MYSDGSVVHFVVGFLYCLMQIISVTYSTSYFVMHLQVFLGHYYVRLHVQCRIHAIMQALQHSCARDSISHLMPCKTMLSPVSTCLAFGVLKVASVAVVYVSSCCADGHHGHLCRSDLCWLYAGPPMSMAR